MIAMMIQILSSSTTLIRDGMPTVKITLTIVNAESAGSKCHVPLDRIR